MTQGEKIWLKSTFVLDYYMKSPVLQGNLLAAYYEAERILEGRKEINRRGCKCNHRHLMTNVHKLLSKFLDDELYKKREEETS